jgi:hypothetical protein
MCEMLHAQVAPRSCRCLAGDRPQQQTNGSSAVTTHVDARGVAGWAGRLPRAPPAACPGTEASSPPCADRTTTDGRPVGEHNVQDDDKSTHERPGAPTFCRGTAPV